MSWLQTLSAFHLSLISSRHLSLTEIFPMAKWINTSASVYCLLVSSGSGMLFFKVQIHFVFFLWRPWDGWVVSMGYKIVFVYSWNGLLINCWVLLGWFWVLYLTSFSSSYPINLSPCFVCQKLQENWGWKVRDNDTFILKTLFWGSGLFCGGNFFSCTSRSSCISKRRYWNILVILDDL